ncbi:MAG: heavy-metal-associated domain-containing protein [Nitritalea sp.]
MLKKIILGAVAIVFLLVATLAVHIYLVTKPKQEVPGKLNHQAMIRIEFPEALDSLKGKDIHAFVSQVEGVRTARMNADAGHVVLIYDQRKTAPADIAQLINADFNAGATVFKPSDEMLAQSCPAINKNSLTYRLGAFFQKAFEN